MLEPIVYNRIRASRISGRYLTNEVLSPELDLLGPKFEQKEIGRSSLDKSIRLIKIGTGPIKILAWSQMHGNESTTTKAVLDYLHFLQASSPEADTILRTVTLYIIPILNPDGAAAYTRVNANGVDLNRDAKELKEVESRILRDTFLKIDPDYCFNLHDQRSIFSAGDTNSPATLSFLAPSIDSQRSINSIRETAMQIIAAIHQDLQTSLPGRIGRYDDSYNPNCTGDQFQQLVPTILFEAGHAPGDYQREQTRYYAFLAISAAVNHIVNNTYKKQQTTDYFSIPQNQKNFVDVLLKNVLLDDRILDIAIYFEEELKGGQVHFIPKITSIGENLQLFGHQQVDGKGKKVQINGRNQVAENDLVHSIVLNGENLSFKIE